MTPQDIDRIIAENGMGKDAVRAMQGGGGAPKVKMGSQAAVLPQEVLDDIGAAFEGPTARPNNPMRQKQAKQPRFGGGNGGLAKLFGDAPEPTRAAALGRTRIGMAIATLGLLCLVLGLWYIGANSTIKFAKSWGLMTTEPSASAAYLIIAVIGFIEFYFLPTHIPTNLASWFKFAFWFTLASIDMGTTRIQILDFAKNKPSIPLVFIDVKPEGFFIQVVALVIAMFVAFATEPLARWLLLELKSLIRG